MDKNKKQQKKKKSKFFYLLMILVILVLFVISAFLSEKLGMLIFGVLTFYVMIGNNNCEVEHNVYEEILQSKRKLLNYEKAPEKAEEKGEKPHLEKYHLIIIMLLFAVMCWGSYVCMEIGMLMFGCIILYILLAGK